MKLLSPVLFVATMVHAASSHAQTLTGPFDFSGIDRETAINAMPSNCSQNSDRAPSIAERSGFFAHPVLLCVDGMILGHALYWSWTNAEGNRLAVQLTSLEGGEFEISQQGFVEGTGNFADTVIDFVDGGRHVCRFWKPYFEISPSTVAECTPQ